MSKKNKNKQNQQVAEKVAEPTNLQDMPVESVVSDVVPATVPAKAEEKKSAGKVVDLKRAYEKVKTKKMF